MCPSTARRRPPASTSAIRPAARRAGETGALSLPTVVPRPPLGSGQHAMVWSRHFRDAWRGSQLARGQRQGRGGAREGKPPGRTFPARRRVARRCPIRRGWAAEGKGIGYSRPRCRATSVAAIRPTLRSSAPDRGADRRPRVADVGRPAQPGGPLAVTDREPPRGRPGHLRVGVPRRPAGSSSATRCGGRAAAERREASHARRRRRGGRGAARRPRARRRGPVRARLLRRSAPRRDPSPRMAGRRARRLRDRRAQGQERGRAPAPAADRRAAAADPAAAEFMRAGRGGRAQRSPPVSVMSGKIAERARRGAGRGGARADHAARVPPHLRELPDGRGLHAAGADGVHGPRRCRRRSAT